MTSHAQKTVILFDIDYTLFDTDHYKQSNLTEHKLYTEIEKVLHELGQECVLGILSEGQYDHQRNKLIKTNILSHFDPDHVHIVSDKLSALAEILQFYKDSDVVLVEDKLPILYHAKQQLPSLKTIWIKRGIYAEKQDPISGFHPDHTLLTLEHLHNQIIELAQEY